MSDPLLNLALELGSSAPRELDLTDGAHLDQVAVMADRFLDVGSGLGELRDLERGLIVDRTGGSDYPLALHLAVKMAVSRRIVLDLPGPAHTTVVFAVYKEDQRILPRSENPAGEDFLVRKVQQLDWLFADREALTWDLLVVDDGCPHQSGLIAESIVRKHGWVDRVRVLFLAEAIADDLPVTRPLVSVDQSRKGGAIELGMWTAAGNERPDHTIVFTDADLSTHLGQTGLLLEGVRAQGKPVAIGSRREPLSVVVKKGVRNDRGKLFIYLWKRIIPILPGVVDTQCGFKAFDASTVRRIVEDMIEKQFAFDIELLIKASLLDPEGIVRVPVAWIDSEALSTTTDLQPYLPMLEAMVKMVRTYLPADPEAAPFMEFIEAMDEGDWTKLLANIPEAITSKEPAEFGGFSGVSADELRSAAGMD